MSSDNYAYDFYNWEQERRCAENVAQQTIMGSIQWGIKSLLSRDKKIAHYSQEYPDSESNASVTTCDLDDFFYASDTKNIKKSSFYYCCFHLFFFRKKKYQYTV
jgi:hypothetical protein